MLVIVMKALKSKSVVVTKALKSKWVPILPNYGKIGGATKS